MPKITPTQARKLAKQAVKVVTVDSPEPVADLTVLFRNRDGTYSVTDNGEEVICHTAAQAIKIIVENLTL